MTKNEIQISNVKITAASDEEAASGLIGYVACLVNGCLRLDGLTLRRAATDGHLLLSFPVRRDKAGREHPYLRPENEETRREIEHQVLAALGLR